MLSILDPYITNNSVLDPVVHAMGQRMPRDPRVIPAHMGGDHVAPDHSDKMIKDPRVPHVEQTGGNLGGRSDLLAAIANRNGLTGAPAPTGMPVTPAPVFNPSPTLLNTVANLNGSGSRHVLGWHGGANVY